jgi:hypothetical protein
MAIATKVDFLFIYSSWSSHITTLPYTLIFPAILLLLRVYLLPPERVYGAVA